MFFGKSTFFIAMYQKGTVSLPEGMVYDLILTIIVIFTSLI